jgi:hypothetical protein
VDASRTGAVFSKSQGIFAKKSPFVIPFRDCKTKISILMFTLSYCLKLKFDHDQMIFFNKPFCVTLCLGGQFHDSLHDAAA